MHNKRLARDDLLKIEVSSFFFSQSLHFFDTNASGPVLLHLPPGVSILAASVSVPQLVAAPLLAVAVVLHLLDVDVATILHVRMTDVIEITIDVTVTALAAQRTG